jgi:YHS domain-containing protein
MKAIRRTALAALMLGITIGCAGEEDAASPANPAAPAGGGMKPPPSNAGGMKPAGSDKAAPSQDMTPPPPPADVKKPAADGPKMEPPKTGKADAPAATLSAEELAEIKKLPAAEQDAAIKQVVCPVSSHHLGSMEKPIKVTAEGRTFYLCCESCQDDLKADPKSVIAKLDAQAAKK